MSRARAVTGSHKTIGRGGSICVLGGPFELVFVNENARACDDARMTRRAARGDTNGDDTRTVPRATLRRFAANRSGDPNVSWRPESCCASGYFLAIGVS